MRQPISPRPGQDVKAEHLLSHAQAIEWLYSRLKYQSERIRDEPLFIDYRMRNFRGIDTYPINKITKTVIGGGLIRAGVDNFSIPDYVLDLTIDISKFVWVKINIVANMDDDNSLILQGIKSATVTTGIILGDVVPSSVQCSIPTGAGSHILYLGQIVIAAGVATYTSAGTIFDPIVLWQSVGNSYLRRFIQ